MKPPEEEFESKIYYISNNLLGDLDTLKSDIEQCGKFRAWVNQQMSHLDFSNEKNFEFFEAQMNKLIEWDTKIMNKVKDTVNDINHITELLGKLSKFHKIWPFSIAVNADMQLISATKFKGDLKSVYRYFWDQYDTDRHVLEKVKKGHHIRAKMWMQTSVLHHGFSYGFTPFAMHITTPRYELRINVLKTIALKRVEQLHRILAKEDNYYKAQKSYRGIKNIVPNY